MNQMKPNRVLVVYLATTLSCVSAFALSYDQNVCANGPTAPSGNDPGIYYGSGNANGGWTVDIQNNIELGLRAHVRYPTAQNIFNSSGNGVYSFTDTTGYGPAGQNRSSWNYDFSIDVNQSGLGSGLLSDYTFRMCIDSDPGAGEAWSYFNPLLIPDNAPSGSTIIAQNSENARFAGVGIPGYDNTIAGSYDFVLQAFDSTGDLAAESYMRINVNGGTASGPLLSPPSVPDAASTAVLLGIGFFGLAFFGFRQNRLQAAS